VATTVALALCEIWRRDAQPAAGLSPIDVTMEASPELLAQTQSGPRGFGAPKEPLKVFDDHPLTKQKIQLLEGRYGRVL